MFLFLLVHLLSFFTYFATSDHYSFAGLGSGAGADCRDLPSDYRPFPSLSTVGSEQSLEEGSLAGARTPRASERSLH